MPTGTTAQQPVEPLRIGRRWWIAPPGTPAPSDPELTPLYLLPGRAFGSGDHPSTQLCLRSLERVAGPGAAAIDLGAGTGILSIAAAKLGARPVLAVDIDPASVDEAIENVRLNGLEGEVEVRIGSLPEALAWRVARPEPVVVVANILTHVLESMLKEGLASAAHPDGWLILSGILRSQTAFLHAALVAAGLEIRAQEELEEWVCLVARPA
jgi:ribosomal protein L11 methyltransferase